MKNRRELILALNDANNKREILKIVNSLNSCDVLWLIENMKKLSNKSQKYLTKTNISVI